MKAGWIVDIEAGVINVGAADLEDDCFMTDDFPEISHLPQRKQRELAHVLKIIFEEFEAAQQTKLSEKKRAGKILKVILFGSYARGDWVEDRESGYRSDYDILVVVNIHSVAEGNELWFDISDRFLREMTITKTIETPVNVIVHDLQEVNSRLSKGRPFFIDIVRDGKVLYEKEGHTFAEPRPLTQEEAKSEAKAYFDQWYPLSQDAMAFAEFGLASGRWRDAAFMLHQATERAYHCFLLTSTLYSPKSHRLKSLRSAAEGMELRLIEIWPRDTKFARKSFERLDRAYVDARYSPHYEITQEELAWVTERIKRLQTLVRTICEERLP
ncbi:Predicted nucleotidyltransferase [Rhizobium sp. NFR07]|uniref:HEPN domain-containing protein n=1 Tax=Rhizobium sp. NFR07 TaxID=1566262 RepID=UPI0008E308A3|nr:Predicted nucleotidyltransferase [Rhizobium sp. NFR07]